MNFKFQLLLSYLQDVPEEYGYSKNDKIGDILIEPEPGYNVRVKCSHNVSIFSFFSFPHSFENMKV